MILTGCLRSQTFDPDADVECGDHGSLVAGSCQCEMPGGLKCWQTNRERSNRHPNGNIKEWCTIGMCVHKQS